jgi:hypothetical protein
MIKTRRFPEHNYLSVFYNGKTVRFQIKDNEPITELVFPEFYDVKITGYCSGGCPWCYQNSSEEEPHYLNAILDIEDFFGEMTQNQRPFQVAIGGGNPNEHPHFIAILEQFHELGIMPNYTTNGIGLTREILEATEKYCGGVALSCHPHLMRHWMKAAYDLCKITQLNFHLIISDEESIDYFEDVYYAWEDKVKYFVLLPYAAQGRAEPKEINYDYLTGVLKGLPRVDNVAFGAGFHGYLQTVDFPVSLYEPEIMSKYLDLKDLKVYKSSFDTEGSSWVKSTGRKNWFAPERK